MRKRIFIFLGACTVLILLAVATLPWWMGVVAREVGGRYGVTFTSYKNIGYGRWAVENLTWQKPGVRLGMGRVEGPHPVAWWWQRSGASGVVVEGLVVDVNAAEQTKSEGKSRISGPYSLVSQLNLIRPWLPPIELRNGTVSWADSQAIEISGVNFVDGEAGAAEVSYRKIRGSVSVSLKGRAGDKSGGDEVATFDARGIDANWTLSGTMGRALNQVQFEGLWLEQTFAGDAVFAEDAWIPDSAKLSTTTWRVPAAEVGLGDYYREITGDILVSWSEGKLRLEPLEIEGVPLEDGVYPPLSIVMEGEGNLGSAKVRRLQISTPGLTLQADEPFEISRESVIDGAVSHLVLSADLAKLPKISASGRVDGTITVTARENDWPMIEAKLHGREIQAAELPKLNGDVVGRLTWPHWTIETAEVKDEFGGTVTVSANGDAQAKTFESGTWTADVTGDSLQPFLPPSFRVERITASGDVSGQWPDVIHAGTWEALGLKVPQLNLMKVDGNWSGRGSKISTDAIAAAGLGQIVVKGRLSLTEVVVDAATIDHDGAQVLQLIEPTTIDWGDGWRVTGGAIEGAGIVARLDVLTALRGSLSAKAQDLKIGWINDWWTLPSEIGSVESLQVAANWDGGPLQFTGNATGELKLNGVGPVRIAVNGVSDETGTQINTFEFGQNNRVFAKVAGRVPVYIDFFRETPWEIDRAGEIDLNVLVAPNPEFWKAVGESQHITVSRPDIAVTLKGTWAKPQATGKVVIGRLSVGKDIAGYELPEITDLVMTLAGDLAGVKIDDGRAIIDGQTVRWSGRLPVDEEGWSRLKAEPLSYLREQGSAHLEVPRADLASVAKFVPDYLVPTGQVSLDLSFSPGGKIDGKLVLSDAVSRPLGPLGALQDIEAEITFADRTILVGRLQALMGGQPVRVEGQATWEPGMQPEFDLKLIGTNLPLVRQTGLLLRGDLELRVTSDAEGRGMVGGAVKLHDGLMLADIRSLVPSGGGERRETRPPYFSVGVEPFANWELDLEVNGERFMRLRTPLLTGEASIAVKLDGTLRNPRALGDVTLDDGVVKLPFARFVIDEGRASLTEAQPYQPELSFSGTGKRFGYDLTMELSGFASDPQLRLSSEPSLPAADVILMAMAGVAPKEEFSYTQGERAMKLGVYFGQEIVSDLLGWEGDGSLSLTTGEKLSRRGKETYRVGYEWSDRWTVTGEYDEFDQYNAGLKWRWLPKPEPEVKEGSDASK